MTRIMKASTVSLLMIALLISIPVQASGEERMLGREEAFSLLDKAFQAQVSLSELDRSKSEIEAILEPYFTEEYMEKFLSENLVEENGKYFVLGSDFALYFIPFFQYNEETKMVSRGVSIYIMEHFEAPEEGPVSYDSHYEAVELKWVDGSWKVSEHYYDNVPDEVMEETYEKDETEDSKKMGQIEERMISLSHFLPLTFASEGAEDTDNILNNGLRDFIHEQVPSILAFGIKPLGIHIPVK